MLYRYIQKMVLQKYFNINKSSAKRINIALDRSKHAIFRNSMKGER